MWGFGKETRRGGTLNCNVTAGMDGAEFFKYLEQSVVTLFPDARNIPGKRVMIIVDSGPGRNNKKLLSLLRARGFIVVTGVPNTTHVTQATDRNYGPFKDIYRRNLEEFVRYRKSMRKTVKPQDIPLLIFGGKADDEDGAPLLRSAFDHAFAFETNRKIWRTIGIFPFNRQCLQDSNVSHKLIMLENGTIDLDADPSSISLILYEEQSATAAAALNAQGFNGDVFLEYAPRVSANRKIAVTCPNTRARQDAMTGAKYYSETFVVTGGDALNSNDYFIAQERLCRQEQIKQLKAVKTEAEKTTKLKEKAEGLIEEFKREKSKDPCKEEGAKLLTVATLKVLYEWKHEKKPTGMKKQDILAEWLRVSNSKAPPSCWTDAEEAELKRLEEDDIRLIDTELGREQKQIISQSMSIVAHMTEEEALAANLSAELVATIKNDLSKSNNN